MKRPLLLLSLLPSGQKERAAPAQVPGLETKDGMVRLPGGSFTMGHDGAFETPFGPKSPAHKVTVKPFWIDMTEVTAEFVNLDTGLKGDGKIHHVTKGGSFLCHVSYCMRYRPAARHSQDSESPANHTGFRRVRDGESAK